MNHTQKKAKHEPSGWSMFTRCSFDKKENKLNYYRGKDCIEKLCKKLKERAMKIINYEEKEMIPLTFVRIKMMKVINIKKRLKIIVSIQENLEEQLIVNVI